MMNRASGSDWLVAQLSWQQPGLWLIVDLLLGVLWLAGLRWLLRRQPITSWLLRSLLVPYMGLLAGGISATRMGLQDVDWGLSLGVGGTLTILILALLVLTRGVVVASTPTEPALSDAATLPISNLWLPSWVESIQTILYCGAWEFHWCFWRSVFAEMLPTVPILDWLTGYWSIWIASIFLLPEIVITERLLPRRVGTSIALIITTLIFLYTYNFWLCWLLHFAIRKSLAWLASVGTTAPLPQS